ncbi:sulfatase [Engelhardtia mirabilis]|uniref:Choline-sulfatase n=1 Tax=Engelhardtia mirabilis TaxID=2528011 RepID=A0A518BF20_9BACT|nr:Choline-sulfatase [Planctomycetes bacterium Pla133]QDU99899.1 Choline-sulfatase [Planctomycetes bacterium Pla86]
MLRACLLTTALAAGLCLTGCEADEPPVPNLLLISVDTLRADALEPYGYGRPTSPNLARLAETSVVFEQAHATSSWTLPTLATVMTGELPSTTHTHTFASSLPLGFDTLAERLRAAGFDTAAVASHTFLGVKYGLHQGFTHFDDDLVNFIADSHNAITSDQVTAKARAFIEAKVAADRFDDGPWFLWAHYFDPHDSYLAHEGFSEPFGTETDRDLYDGEIAFTDHHIGALLSCLDELGLANETVVVFVADHGEEWRDHGSHGHGQTLYEEVVRVPLTLRVPGYAPRRVTEPISTLDLFPTLLELCGVAIPKDLPGRSLVPILAGGAGPDRALVSELRLGVAFDAIRRGSHKLIVDRKQQQVLLFDLATDPLEQRDIAAEEPELVAALRAELEQRLAEAHARGRGLAPSGSSDLSAAEAEALSRLGYAE